MPSESGGGGGGSIKTDILSIFLGDYFLFAVRTVDVGGEPDEMRFILAGTTGTWDWSAGVYLSFLLTTKVPT